MMRASRDGNMEDAFRIYKIDDYRMICLIGTDKVIGVHGFT